jgi:hypothetical protein
MKRMRFEAEIDFNPERLIERMQWHLGFPNITLTKSYPKIREVRYSITESVSEVFRTK